MTRKSRRRLSAEEKELWDKVKQNATPLHPERKSIKIPEIFDPKPEIVAPRPVQPFKIGEKSSATAVPRGPSQTKPPSVQMDHKAFGKLKRGKLKPDARIDLHGMTVARAHGVLMTFVQDCHARNLRLILVITGKGKDRDDGGPIPTPKGILKRQVPQWLALMPLKAMVLQVSEAHLRHGGSGAYYVYLRRRR